jgi:hypothetical protein
MWLEMGGQDDDGGKEKTNGLDTMGGHFYLKPDPQNRIRNIRSSKYLFF